MEETTSGPIMSAALSSSVARVVANAEACRERPDPVLQAAWRSYLQTTVLHLLMEVGRKLHTVGVAEVVWDGDNTFRDDGPLKTLGLDVRIGGQRAEILFETDGNFGTISIHRGRRLEETVTHYRFRTAEDLSPANADYYLRVLLGHFGHRHP